MTLGIACGSPWRGRAIDAKGLRRALLPSVVVEALVWPLVPWLPFPWMLLVVFLALLETVGTVPGSTTPANPSGEPTTAGVAIALLLLPFVLAHAVPSMALAVRRLHDANLSGWFYLLSLIPFVGGLVILVLTLLPSKPEGARFDR